MKRKILSCHLTFILIDASFAVLPVTLGTSASIRSRQIHASVLAGVSSRETLVQIRARTPVRGQSEPDRTRAKEASGGVPASKLAGRWLSGAFVDVQTFGAGTARFEALDEKSFC